MDELHSPVHSEEPGVARALAAWWLAVPSAVTLMLGEVANESPQERRRVLVKLVNDATRKP
jgi:hypothetical protein